MTRADFANCGKAYWSPHIAHATGHWIMPRKHAFVKSHPKDTKELESFPQVLQGRVRSSRCPHWWACCGQVAGEAHLTLRDILVTHSKWWKCHFLAWRAHTQTTHEKTPRTKAQGQRSQSRGQDRSRSYFKANCNGRDIPTFKSQPKETPKPLNINKYHSIHIRD